MCHEKQTEERHDPNVDLLGRKRKNTGGSSFDSHENRTVELKITLVKQHFHKDRR